MASTQRRVEANVHNKRFKGGKAPDSLSSWHRTYSWHYPVWTHWGRNDWRQLCGSDQQGVWQLNQPKSESTIASRSSGQLYRSEQRSSTTLTTGLWNKRIQDTRTVAWSKPHREHVQPNQGRPETTSSAIPHQSREQTRFCCQGQEYAAQLAS